MINVLLVDDHVIVRNGVQLMLESDPDIHVAGQAENATQAMEQMKNGRFDVALVDISLPGKNGIDLLKSLRAEYPKLAVLMLSAYAEDVYAIRAIRNGASGYLTKDSPAGRLVAAVKAASMGGKCISPGVAEKLANLVSGKTPRGFESLSDREMEVLKLIASGTMLEGYCIESQSQPAYRDNLSCPHLEKDGNERKRQSGHLRPRNRPAQLRTRLKTRMAPWPGAAVRAFAQHPSCYYK